MLWKIGAPRFYLNRAFCTIVFLSRDRFAALPTLVSDTSRGESRACLFCQWNNDNVIARGRFATAPLPRGRRLDADMLIWRPFRDIKFSVYRFSPDEPRLDVHITFHHCAFDHAFSLGVLWGLCKGTHESLLAFVELNPFSASEKFRKSFFSLQKIQPLKFSKLIAHETMILILNWVY